MKTKIVSKQVIIFTLILLIGTAVQAQSKVKSSSTFPTANEVSNVNLTYKIIDAPNKTFGYDIYADNKRLIHQSSVPAIAGNEGFKTKTAAAKVAKLVISKLQKGETLPTVTIEEMEKLTNK